MAELVRAYEVPAVKLTSGQRIGFYGLSRDNIHALCEAMPFRTGGHYVQACPGTTWCKFGKQDALGLARTLEENTVPCQPLPKSNWGFRLHLQLRRIAVAGHRIHRHPQRLAYVCGRQFRHETQNR